MLGVDSDKLEDLYPPVRAVLFVEAVTPASLGARLVPGGGKQGTGERS